MILAKSHLQYFRSQTQSCWRKNVAVYSKPTNSFTYVLPSTCYPYKNMQNVPKGITLRLWHISDIDERYNQCSSEYQNYLIATEYGPTSVKKQFEEVCKIMRTQAWASKQKPNQIKKINFLLATIHVYLAWTLLLRSICLYCMVMTT